MNRITTLSQLEEMLDDIHQSTDTTRLQDNNFFKFFGKQSGRLGNILQNFSEDESFDPMLHIKLDGGVDYFGRVDITSRSCAFKLYAHTMKNCISSITVEGKASVEHLEKFYILIDSLWGIGDTI